MRWGLRRRADARALSENHFDIAKYLYSQGARPETATAGVNPVFRAITNGNTQTAEWLVQIGFNLHLTYRTASGKLRNALVYAKESGTTEITELLLKEGCKLPVEGVDIPVNEAEVKSVEPTAADRIRAEIVSFLGQQFGHVEELALQEILPVLDDVSVAIKVIRPNEQRSVMTLFTTGVSDQPLTVPADKEAYQFAELVMHLPATWPHPKDALSDEEALWPFQCLRKTAYKPHITESWFGAPATIISDDEPLGPNVKHTCLLLLADRIPPLDSKEGKQIRFFTVVPLYAEERDFATQHGLDVLVERLTDRGLLVFDPERENVGVQ